MCVWINKACMSISLLMTFKMNNFADILLDPNLIFREKTCSTCEFGKMIDI